MNYLKATYSTLLLLGLVIISSSTWADEASAKKTAISLVGKALAHVEAVGLEQALEDLKQPDNPFQDGDVYVFIYDFEGNNLVNSVPLNLPGTNLNDIRSPDGKLVVQQMIEMTKASGGGAFEYDWVNPESQQIQSKISYFKRIPDFDGFIGSGYYQAKKPLAKKEAIALVRQALSHIETVGLDQALRDFKQPDNPFRDDELYVFVYDFEGNNLANSAKISIPGVDLDKNLAQVRGPDGKLVVQQMIEMSKSRGWGAFEYEMVNPVTQQLQPKISYFRKIPDFAGLVGSGYYISKPEK
ncbi:MAG: cache domain-containing protein [Candidatus Competibacteraceae bacterium]|jgi:signal transduction histidine kinase|nr:cache domain-containing protein [Candidatus Competibacteraceae bacterium]